MAPSVVAVLSREGPETSLDVVCVLPFLALDFDFLVLFLSAQTKMSVSKVVRAQ